MNFIKLISDIGLIVYKEFKKQNNKPNNPVWYSLKRIHKREISNSKEVLKSKPK